MVSAPAWPRKRVAKCSPAAGPRAASASQFLASEPPGPGRGKPARSFTFTARQRLLKAAQFEHVYRRGRRLQQKLFQATVCPNDLGFARLGLSIASRAVGNAVARNRIRRRVREIFRHRQDLPALDVVISARPAARTAESADLQADLDRLLTTICEQCTPAPQPS